MSTRIDYFEKKTFTGTPDSLCKIGDRIYVCSNVVSTTTTDGYIHLFNIDANGVLSIVQSQVYTFAVRRITTDGNRLYAVSDLDGTTKIVRVFDPATLNTIGNTYNMGYPIYGPIHASTAGFLVVQREWVTGTSFDNTRLLQFDGSAFLEISQFPARLAYHVIGLRMLSVIVSTALTGYLYTLGADRTVSSTLSFPLVSGTNKIGLGAAIISETRVALAEAGRVVLYSVPSGVALSNVALSLTGMGRMVTDGRYLYITNSTAPHISVYDTFGDVLRFADSASFPSETGLTSVHVSNIVYGSNMLFVLSSTGLHSFTKSLAADFTISNPTPAVGETVTFQVI